MIETQPRHIVFACHTEGEGAASEGGGRLRDALDHDAESGVRLLLASAVSTELWPLWPPDRLARLSAFRCELPPIRERREDLGCLIASLLAQEPTGNPIRLEAQAGRALLSPAFPGNLHELQQCLDVGRTLSHGEAIALEHLPPQVRGKS